MKNIYDSEEFNTTTLNLNLWLFNYIRSLSLQFYYLQAIQENSRALKEGEKDKERILVRGKIENEKKLYKKFKMK